MSEPLHIVCPHCNAANRVPAERVGNGPRCGHSPARIMQSERFTPITTFFTTSSFSSGCGMSRPIGVSTDGGP